MVVIVSVVDFCIRDRQFIIKCVYCTFLIFENINGGIEVIKVSDINLTRKVTPSGTLE